MQRTLEITAECSDSQDCQYKPLFGNSKWRLRYRPDRIEVVFFVGHLLTVANPETEDQNSCATKLLNRYRKNNWVLTPATFLCIMCPLPFVTTVCGISQWTMWSSKASQLASKGFLWHPKNHTYSDMVFTEQPPIARNGVWAIAVAQIGHYFERLGWLYGNQKSRSVRTKNPLLWPLTTAIRRCWIYVIDIAPSEYCECETPNIELTERLA